MRSSWNTSKNESCQTKVSQRFNRKVLRVRKRIRKAIARMPKLGIEQKKRIDRAAILANEEQKKGVIMVAKRAMRFGFISEADSKFLEQISVMNLKGTRLLDQSCE